MSTIYYENSNSSTNTMTKVFGWLFYAILLTSLTAFGLPYLLVMTGATEAYSTILMVGLIAVFLLSFIGNIVIMKTRSKTTAITVYSLFAISMGIWISPLVIVYELGTIIYSLFITSAIFGIMAVYGAITKRDLSSFGTFLFMLLLGCFILSLFNIFFASSQLNWFLSYIILAIYIGFIAFDIQRVKRLAQSGNLNLNISLLMALNLYIDFVYVFIRVVSLVANNKK